MKKEDRQIIWKLDWLCYAGFYKEYKIFECFEWGKSQWEVNLILGGFKTKIGTYTTYKSAKRGAERFLKRLQEAVKWDKKKPKTCDDCWLGRDFGHYIPAGYCADKCAKIYNALKD